LLSTVYFKLVPPKIKLTVMKNVLLLTDFSNTARNAALYALKMLNDEHVHFTLLNAYDLEFSGSPYIAQLKEEMAYESEKGLKEELSILKRLFPNAVIEPLSVFGSLIDVAQNSLKEKRPDLMVLGCRGESALENFLLGSNAYEVVKSIHSPILVVPKSAKFKRPDKIVFATDLKDVHHDDIINPLRDILDRYRAALLFVNVLDDDMINRLDAENKIVSHFPNVNVSFNFVEGHDVAKGINRFMDENDVEIVTMIRHNVGFFDRIFHPSVTKQMILNPEHPMLILHDEED